MDFFMDEELPPYAQEFIKEMYEKGRKETSIKRYVYDLLDFLSWMEKEKGDKSFETWSTLDIEDYLDFFRMLTQERRNSKRTLFRFRTVLNQLARHYEQKGHRVAFPGTIVMESLTKEKKLTESDFISESEWLQLKTSVVSPVGLSEKRLLSRPFLINRNLSILTLFYDYGMTMNELSDLVMRDVNLVSRTISIVREGYKRLLEIDRKDALLLNYYVNDIPKPVRPRTNSNDPFFVAFDFYRGTFHWDYSQGKPKELTVVAIQKMIRGEIAKASFHRQLTARNLRNTSILNGVFQRQSKKELLDRFGFKTEWYINRYLQYAFTIEPELEEVYKEDEKSSIH